MTTAATALNREALTGWYRRNRERSRQLFDIVRPEAYYSRPISLRHPIVFYEGHLPAFSLNTLVKKGLARPGVDERLERLFARGIDPEDEAAASRSQAAAWPSRDEVRRFADECDRLVLDALANAPIEQPGHPLLHEGEAAFAILEHEAMHQETMLYMWHQLLYEDKQAPAVISADVGASPSYTRTGASQSSLRVRVPAGRATLGAQRGDIPFGWDNEFEALIVGVPGFAIDAHNVTNEQFMDFVDAGGYQQSEWWTLGAFAWIRQEGIEHPRFWTRRSGTWMWRGMFDETVLTPAWPVYVSQAEAAAYARWKGARLMTEAEYHRAAFAEPSGSERPYPWGDAPPDQSRGLFDFRSWNPAAVGTHPAGQSAWGVHDLFGNGWEWTSTVFAPFDGFRPMASYPEYSADFFDGQHVVMKGASPATAVELVRRSFRNWFRPNYPYVYATFRCAWPIE
jgi:gamma-glutamyl hercynylcysteine S-oxide synthase